MRMKCQNKLTWLVTVTSTLRYRFEYELSTLTKKTVIINISKFGSHLKNDYETLILNPRWIKLNNEIFVFLNCPPKTVQDPTKLIQPTARQPALLSMLPNIQSSKLSHKSLYILDFVTSNKLNMVIFSIYKFLNNRL